MELTIRERFGYYGLVWGLALLGSVASFLPDLVRAPSRNGVLGLGFMLTLGLWLVADHLYHRQRGLMLVVHDSSLEVVVQGLRQGTVRRERLVLWGARQRLRDLVRGSVGPLFALVVGLALGLAEQDWQSALPLLLFAAASFGALLFGFVSLRTIELPKQRGVWTVTVSRRDMDALLRRPHERVQQPAEGVLGWSG